MYENSFIQKCLNGEADLSELDKYIEYWHTHDVEVSLRDYLGLTPSEYEKWGNGSNSIFRDILRCRMEGISLENSRMKDKKSEKEKDNFTYLGQLEEDKVGLFVDTFTAHTEVEKEQ